MKHFLIIGGGLAGSTLAYHFLNRNCKVTVVDSGENHSSKVAAGQINPMVFRRMNKSWRVDEFLPFARSLFETFEKITDQKIIAEKSIRRMFAHEQEKEMWLKKQELPEFFDYLEKITEQDLSFDKAKNICGSGRVKNSFYVMSIPFLEAIKGFISNHENGEWKTELVDYEEIDSTKTQWKGSSYDGIVFCSGYLNNENPYFNFLEVDQTKGEVLNVKGNIYNEESLNRKCFLLPKGNNEFRVGSNYEWDTPDTNPTEKAKVEILANLSSLIDAEVEVVDHQAGIRPTTRDRRPIMGKHPDIEGFYIFNGLGAKGYLTAPLLSKELTEFILDSSPLSEEVDLRRYL